MTDVAFHPSIEKALALCRDLSELKEWSLATAINDQEIRSLTSLTSGDGRGNGRRCGLTPFGREQPALHQRPVGEVVAVVFAGRDDEHAYYGDVEVALSRLSVVIRHAMRDIMVELHDSVALWIYVRR